MEYHIYFILLDSTTSSLKSKYTAFNNFLLKTNFDDFSGLQNTVK